MDSVTGSGLTVEELADKEFSVYDENSKPVLDKETSVVVYVRITSESGGVAYISTDGMIVNETGTEPTPAPTPTVEPTVKPTVEPKVEPSTEPTVTPTVIPEPVDVMKGDVDNNKTITLTDAQLTLKAALKIITLDEKETKAADVDNNQTVTLADAQLILKYALKIITKFE